MIYYFINIFTYKLIHKLLKYIFNQISYARNILNNIINFTYAKPITREIMDYKIKYDKLNNMNDGYGAIEYWNTSQITNMSNLFKNKYEFNRDISKWDVLNVINMKNMFYNCYRFNQNISNWDVSNVVNMSGMFRFCLTFNHLINKWNVSSFKYEMFLYCDNFSIIK